MLFLTLLSCHGGPALAVTASIAAHAEGALTCSGVVTGAGEGGRGRADQHVRLEWWIGALGG